MSAYMVENENLCKMARYISDILTAQDMMGTVTGVKKIWVNKPTVNLFKGFKGFYDAAHGEFRAEALHKALYEMNRDAIIACYGKCAECFEPFDGKNVDEREETRDEWQCRLFTVIRNYLYQCTEGDVPETNLFKAVSAIQTALANRIAAETATRDWGCGWSDWKPTKKGERQSKMADMEQRPLRVLDLTPVAPVVGAVVGGAVAGPAGAVAGAVLASRR